MVKNKGHSVENVEAYEKLAGAVIVIACKDYRKVLKKLARNPGNRDALVEKRTIEKFFRSEWFGVLTSVDPEMLINRLQKEVMDK